MNGMTADRASEVYEIIGQVRTCFNLLRSLADRLHEDLGVNPSMRAVMEALTRESGRTVPDIAREKGVSRQHVQVIMNALLEAGLVESADNPAHRRSPLFVLTGQAQAVFAEIRRREAEPTARLAEALPAESLAATRTLLAELNRRLRAELAAGDPP